MPGSKEHDGAPNPLFGKSLLSIRQLSRSSIERVLGEAESMKLMLDEGKVEQPLRNRIMATLFFEPSTRTRLSFESSMQRLGGGVIGFADANTTSSVKGESLADTVEVVSNYADIIVIRHPKMGSADEAAKHSRIPVVNAGDGAGQHPTQALYDMFTVKAEKGRLENLKVALVGDLKNARTIRSFAYALAMFGNDLTFIGPKQLQMPGEVLRELSDGYGIRVETSESLDDALDADVVYIPRIQKERFADVEEYKRHAANFYTTFLYGRAT